MMIELWSEFAISEYEGSEFESVSEFFQRTYSHTYPRLDPSFLVAARFRKILHNTIDSAELLQIAKHNGEVVGFVALCPNFIDQLYIGPEHQGKGLGSHWLADAKSRNPDLLELFTLASNDRAVSFYGSHGFRIVERGTAPDERVPDVRMRWEPMHLIDHRP